MKTPALALLTLAVLLLSGCAGTSPLARGKQEVSLHGEGNDLPTSPRVRLDPPSQLTFMTPAILGTVTLGAEPSIDAAPDGTVYVTTPLALWRSTDGGNTFTWLGSPSCPAGLPQCGPAESRNPGIRGGGDGDIAVTPDNRLHWLGLADGNNAIPYQNSSTHGDAWSPVVDLAGNDSADREWITARADGTLFAAWRNFPPTSTNRPAAIVVRTSYDGGTTWTDASTVANDTRQGGVAVDPSSSLIVLPYDVNGRIMLARSWDNGTTWESNLVFGGPTRSHIFPVASIDSAGTIYVVFAEDLGDDLGVRALPNRDLETPDVYLVVSHDHGGNFTKPVRLNPPGTTGIFPWIAAGGPGRVAIAWYQNQQGTPMRLGGLWYVTMAVSLDADFEAPRFTIRQVSTSPMHVGGVCTNGSACLLGTSAGDRSLLDFFQVAIHPAGYPVVAWTQDAEVRLATAKVAASRMTVGPDLLEGFH